MIVTLNKEDIDHAIKLGQVTLARYVAAYGEYNNTFNSHTKGRFGEIAVHKYFSSIGSEVIPNYLNPSRDWECDLVIPSASFPRVEVKTWSESFWPTLGRCITPKQAKKLSHKTDAVIWCTVPLPILKSPSDLARIDSLDVRLRAYSLPSDVLAASLRYTGDEDMRQVLNHQLDEDKLRLISEVLNS